MAAGKYTFTVEQGSTHQFEVVWKDSNGVPINLANYTAEMQIKSQVGGVVYGELTSSLTATPAKTSTAALLSLSGSDGTTPLASGSIGVYLGHEVTSAFNFTDALYDLEVTNGQERTRLLSGKIRLSKEITT